MTEIPVKFKKKQHQTNQSWKILPPPTKLVTALLLLQGRQACRFDSSDTGKLALYPSLNS